MNAARRRPLAWSANAAMVPITVAMMETTTATITVNVSNSPLVNLDFAKRQPRLVEGEVQRLLKGQARFADLPADGKLQLEDIVHGAAFSSRTKNIESPDEATEKSLLCTSPTSLRQSSARSP